MFIKGFLAVSQYFPFAFGLGARRKDFFAGTASIAVFLSAVFAVVLTALSSIEKATDGWGTRLHFFRILTWLLIPAAFFAFISYLLLRRTTI